MNWELFAFGAFWGVLGSLFITLIPRAWAHLGAWCEKYLSANKADQ